MTRTFDDTCPGSFDGSLTLTDDNTLSIDGSGADCDGVFSFIGTTTRFNCVQVAEREPNDSIQEIEILGPIRQGQCFTIRGDVASVGNLDGYRLSLDGPQIISAVLTHGYRVDFDLEFFSVNVVGDLVEICTAVESTGVCSSILMETEDDLDVILVSFTGTGDYTLETFSNDLPTNPG